MKLFRRNDQSEDDENEEEPAQTDNTMCLRLVNWLKTTQLLVAAWLSSI